MHFSQFLKEAEWVNGQRYPTIEALWHILQPLMGSKNHLLALGSFPIEPIAGKTKILNPSGGDDIPQTQGSRAYPTYGGTTDPNTFAVGVRTFMKNGINSFTNEYSHHQDDKEVLHVIRVNLKDVWTIDPKFNDKNPWIVMKTHWQDLKQEFKRLNPISRNSKTTQNEWENLSAKIERFYQGADDVGERDLLARIQYLFHLIYVEAPRFLEFVKTGVSYGAKPYAMPNFKTINIGQKPNAMDIHFPTKMRFDFKIISKTLPLNDTPWAIIIDPKAITTENTIVIPVTFTGFHSAGPQAFRAPNARADAAQKVIDQLDEVFRNQLITSLETFLETLAGGFESNYVNSDWLSRVIEEIKENVDNVKTIINKIKIFDPTFKFPFKTTLDDFKTQMYQLIDEIYNTIDDEEPPLKMTQMQDLVKEIEDLLDTLVEK